MAIEAVPYNPPPVRQVQYWFTCKLWNSGDGPAQEVKRTFDLIEALEWLDTPRSRGFAFVNLQRRVMP